MPVWSDVPEKEDIVDVAEYSRTTRTCHKKLQVGVLETQHRSDADTGLAARYCLQHEGCPSMGMLQAVVALCRGSQSAANSRLHEGMARRAGDMERSRAVRRSQTAAAVRHH